MHSYLVTKPCFIGGRRYKVGDTVKSGSEIKGSCLTLQSDETEKKKRKPKSKEV